MKKTLIASAVGLAAFGLLSGAALAWFGKCKNSCCAYKYTICCKPYNAFSPICCGNMFMEGCCPPFGMGCAMPGCGPGFKPMGGPGYCGADCFGCESGCLGQLPAPTTGGTAVLPLNPAPSPTPGQPGFTPPMPTPLDGSKPLGTTPTAQGRAIPMPYPVIQPAGYYPYYPPAYYAYPAYYGYPAYPQAAYPVVYPGMMPASPNPWNAGFGVPVYGGRN